VFVIVWGLCMLLCWLCFLLYGGCVCYCVVVVFVIVRWFFFIVGFVFFYSVGVVFAIVWRCVCCILGVVFVVGGGLCLSL